jgi:hypothetical protein
MFRFAAGKLLKGELSELETWTYLEDFLLHYRNLIDFLGHDDPRRTDLHISKPELLGVSQPNDATIFNRLNTSGTRLWEDGDTGSDVIAKYLHHCTMKRIESKSWPVGTMNDILETLLSDLELLLANVKRSWPSQSAVRFLGSASMSIASGPQPKVVRTR